MSNSPVTPYIPAPVPANSTLLADYLRRELERIALSINSIGTRGENGQFLPLVDTTPTTATAGTAATLPAKPAIYAEILLDGSKYRVPVFNP